MRLLDQTVRQDGGRVIAALAATFRDLDLAEDAFAEACARAVERWEDASPTDPAAWLYAVARRWALDRLRRRATEAAHCPDDPAPDSTPEERLMAQDDPIPDERLRLIFVCCHPAIAPEARAALTLRTVCGLTTARIAAAYLVPEATLAQRLVRAKRKISQAGIPFEVPAPGQWSDRLDAVLSTLEIAYAQAHADAALTGPQAAFACDILDLTALLCRLMPEDAEVAALAATVRLTEARRPARLDDAGAMVPLSDQNPAEWDAALIAAGETWLATSARLSRQHRRPPGPRALQAAIHGAHASRRHGGPTPWLQILGLYDALLRLRDDPVVRTNRVVALAEVAGPATALSELERHASSGWLPYHVTRADLLVRLGRDAEAVAEYDAALALDPAAAETLFLRARRAASVAA